MLHDNEVISIEEASYHIRANSCVRRFKLINHLTNFQIIIKNTGATIISCCKTLSNCKDDDDGKLKSDMVTELIRQDNDENQISQTQQINSNSNSTKRNQLSSAHSNEFEWQSHVLGLDSISFATNSHHNSSITYQLNVDNSLSMLGKLRSLSHLSYLVPFYFNLNINSTNSTVDGHFLQIKGIKLDKQLDSSNAENSLSLSLSSNSTSDSSFIDHQSFFKSPGRVSWSNLQDTKVYDLIYTLNGRYKEAMIIAILSYGTRRIEVSIQNSLNNYSNQMMSTFGQQSTITSNNNSQNLCKLRVKITRNGIALLPVATEFKTVYKFHF